MQEETIFVIGRKRSHAYSLNSAEPLATLETDGYRWRRGRVFEKNIDLLLLSLSGSALKFEPIPNMRSWQSTVFELDGCEGPLRFGAAGEIQTVASQPRIVRAGMGQTIVFEGIATDDRTFVVQNARESERFYLVYPES